jgi:hypothetical protein
VSPSRQRTVVAAALMTTSPASVNLMALQLGLIRTASRAARHRAPAAGRAPPFAHRGYLKPCRGIDGKVVGLIAEAETLPHASLPPACRAHAYERKTWDKCDATIPRPPRWPPALCALPSRQCRCSRWSRRTNEPKEFEFTRRKL